MYLLCNSPSILFVFASLDWLIVWLIHLNELEHHGVQEYLFANVTAIPGALIVSTMTNTPCYLTGIMALHRNVTKLATASKIQVFPGLIMQCSSLLAFKKL